MSFEFYVTIKGKKQGQFKSETKKDKVHADRYQAAQSQAQGQTLQSE